MKGKVFSFVAILLLTGIISAQSNSPKPIWLTEEERNMVPVFPSITRIAPPDGSKIFSPPEFGRSEGIIIQVRSDLTDYYGEMMKHVTNAGAKIYAIVAGSRDISRVNSMASSMNIPSSKIVFLNMNYDANWTRDYSPWFVYVDGERSIVDHNYKPGGRPNDDEVPLEIGDLWNEDVYSTGFFTEGGNFMTDGRGICWQSTKVLGNWASADDWSQSPKNPDMTQQNVEKLFRDYLGCEQLVSPPPLPDENTGHIDMYSKILNQDTIIVSYSKSAWGASQEEIALLDQIAEIYENSPRPDGGNWNIVRIPMRFSYGTYYTYTNSLIVNDHVLVPTYENSLDQEAIKIYEQLMPNHKVVGFDSRQIIQSGGAIHCTTMQVPPENYSPCGDGVVAGDEECELNYLLGKTCKSFGFENGKLKCSPNCRFDTSDCSGKTDEPQCGDGEVNGADVCDGNSKNCSDLDSDYVSGTATCLHDCSGFDESACVKQTPSDGDGSGDEDSDIDQVDYNSDHDVSNSDEEGGNSNDGSSGNEGDGTGTGSDSPADAPDDSSNAPSSEEEISEDDSTVKRNSSGCSLLLL